MTGSSYGQAFLLTTIAGFSTFIGAALPCFIKLSNMNYLVLSLSLAAGVMTYISLVEMMSQCVSHFRESDFFMNPVLAQSVFFFLGVLVCVGLDVLIKKVSGEENQFEMGECFSTIEGNIKAEVEVENDMAITEADALEKGLNLNKNEYNYNNGSLNNLSSKDTKKNSPHNSQNEMMTAKNDENSNSENRSALKRLSLLTALAITLHNIPEGVATFSSALSDSGIGLSLCVAISIHNIPEGLSVAFPVYFSTGSKLKAFLWGAFSGISEPLAALVELIILKICRIEDGDFTTTAYGIIFGIVAGIMTHISICELLPTAKRYDAKGNLTVIGFTIGMAIMAISLVFLDVFN